MEVKNFIIDDIDSFTESLVKDMFDKNIDYLLIKYKNYNEIHFDNSIIRYGKAGYMGEILHDMDFCAEVEELMRTCTHDPFEGIFKKLDQAKKNYEANEKTGYKVLKKGDYKGIIK